VEVKCEARVIGSVSESVSVIVSLKTTKRLMNKDFFIAMWPWSWLLPRPARTNTKRSVMNSTSRVLLQKKRKQSAIFVALQPAETHVNPSVWRTGSSKSVLGFGTVRCHCRVLTSRRLQGFWWLLNRKPLHSTYLIIYPCILINIYLDIHIYP
jgi:hypothetical protein